MVVLTFVLVVAIVFGMYWVFVDRPERASEAALRRRLGGGRLAAQVAEGLQRKSQRLSAVPLFDRLLNSRAGVVAPVERMIGQSGVKTTVGVVLLSCGCLFMLGLLAGQLWVGSLWVGALFGLVLLTVPVIYLRWRSIQRVRRFEELFPEALDLMSRAMRGGHTFVTALGMVAEELPDPIAAEFKLLHDQQNFGMPLNEALRIFGERVPLLAAKFFVTAIVTQRESGGNLTEVLDNLAKVIRDRFMVMRQVRVKSAHGRITGWVLVALPPTVALILGFVSPHYYDAMLGERIGIQMIAVAVVLQISGALIIRKIINIDY
jgi:tight adherence protein B